MAPTTVRSWDRRYGLGPDAQTGGRRRRWTAGDVARLERMCALTAAGLPPGRGRPAWRATRWARMRLRRRWTPLGPRGRRPDAAPVSGWGTRAWSAGASLVRPMGWGWCSEEAGRSDARPRLGRSDRTGAAASPRAGAGRHGCGVGCARVRPCRGTAPARAAGGRSPWTPSGTARDGAAVAAGPYDVLHARQVRLRGPRTTRSVRARAAREGRSDPGTRLTPVPPCPAHRIDSTESRAAGLPLRTDRDMDINGARVLVADATGVLGGAHHRRTHPPGSTPGAGRTRHDRARPGGPSVCGCSDPPVRRVRHRVLRACGARRSGCPGRAGRRGDGYSPTLSAPSARRATRSRA